MITAPSVQEKEKKHRIKLSQVSFFGSDCSSMNILTEGYKMFNVN